MIEFGPVSSNLPVHAPLPYFQVNADGHLLIGGQSVVDIARRFGDDTPFYAYDRQVIQDRIAALRAALPSEIHLHYAIKANPMPDVVRFVAPFVDGIDVASAKEMVTAIENGAEPQHISFTGPGKTDAELDHAVRSGVVINVESERELAPIVAAGQKYKTRPQITVRINPDFELKGSGMRMGGGAKQFGIDAEIIPDILQKIKTMEVDFLGFHIFSGSNCLNAAAIIDAQDKTFELAIRLAKESGITLKTLNIGGGLGVPYFPGDTPLDLSKVGEHLTRKMVEVRRDLPETEIIMELGRYIIAESGVYVCRVIDRKFSRGHIFLITNGGLHHHLSASGNFGQLIRKNFPVIIGNRMIEGRETELVNVVGPLCTPLDILADKMHLPKAEIGDYVVVFQSGAYGLTASPIHFLSHPVAREVLV